MAACGNILAFSSPVQQPGSRQCFGARHSRGTVQHRGSRQRRASLQGDTTLPVVRACLRCWHAFTML